MLSLLATTVFTSAADSLNPTAITQQFVLQGMVKKPKHIWFFILATGITNFAGGLMVYFGLDAVIYKVINFVMTQFGAKIFIVEFILGIIALIFAFYTILNQKIMQRMAAFNSQIEADNEQIEKQQASKKVKSVTPTSLFILGMIATIAELATALPYFAFLAVLLNYQLSVFFAVFILIIYNLIYSLPLMILYYIYKETGVF